MPERVELEPGGSVTVHRAPQNRLCAWCLERPVQRRGQRYCSQSHRQRAYEERLAELAGAKAVVDQSRQAYQAGLELQRQVLERHRRLTQTRKEVPE